MAIEILFKNQLCEWVDIEAPTPEDLHYIHERYGILDLLLEDTIDANHLPKYEQDGDVKFYLMRENTELERTNLNAISDVSTKLGLFLVKNTVITIHRMKNRSIYEYKKDIMLHPENIDADHIALQLAIRVMKSYDEESQNLLEIMDKMEDEIFLKNSNQSNQLRRLYKLKRKSGLNARILNISADWVNKCKLLNVSDSEFTDLVDKYKDVVADFEHLNAQITSLISMFLALSDQKANQVMKLLAMYSVYFLPLTFIAGIYGMNFENMPELDFKYGYYYTLALMAFIVIVTFLYFRRKKWN